MYDGIMRRWPGYTISTIDQEDAHKLLQMTALLDDDLGKAETGD